MLQRQLIKLGKLTHEQKEQTWSATISGSQAWMLVNEPYNLLRDKLGVPRVHPSKYDIFKSGVLKEASEKAMKRGTIYEASVFEEVKELHPTAVRTDITFQLKLFSPDGSELPYLITSTPDWYIEVEDNLFEDFGDIKCSSSAHDEAAMKERYYYQLLHNAYVLNCYQAELNCKFEVTKDLSNYRFTFTEEDFNNYEQLLINFYFNLQFRNEAAYDKDYVAPVMKQTNSDIELKDAVVKEVEDDYVLQYVEYAEKKAQLKQLEKEVKDFEANIKSIYDNATLQFGNQSLIVKSIVKKGTIDYAKAVEEIFDKYGISTDILEEYRKAPTVSKTLTIK